MDNIVIQNYYAKAATAAGTSLGAALAFAVPTVALEAIIGGPALFLFPTALLLAIVGSLRVTLILGSEEVVIRNWWRTWRLPARSILKIRPSCSRLPTLGMGEVACAGFEIAGGQVISVLATTSRGLRWRPDSRHARRITRAIQEWADGKNIETVLVPGDLLRRSVPGRAR
jgi:hypothetical protein